MTKPNKASKPAAIRPSDPLRDSIAYSASDDTELPDDIVTFRFALVRRIMNFLGEHARCPNGACKRRKLCVGATLSCHRPGPPMSADEQARITAQVTRAIREVRARHESADAGASPSARRLAPSPPSSASRDRRRRTAS